MILKVNVYYECDLQVKPEELTIFKDIFERLTYKMILETWDDTERITIPNMNEFLSGETLNKNKHKGLHLLLLAPEEIQGRIMGKPPKTSKEGMIPLDLKDNRMVIKRRRSDHKTK